MNDPEELVRFYERGYSQPADAARRYSAWRSLGAQGKADHVLSLCARGGVRPLRVLEVGCGDGALLAELGRRGFATERFGVEIAQAAVEIARSRPLIDGVELYDGSSLPFADHSFDLGILSHVLEHVAEPAALLAEVSRVCRAVLVEVPLEANLSARRARKRAHAAEVGHLRKLSRSDVREIVAGSGLQIAAELEDPLPLGVHRFFAADRRARAAADIRWGVRATLHRLAPALARRSFTLHYACLCLPRAE
jgi:SAM-dependent methyltransferase